MGDPSNSFGGFYSRAEKLFNNKNFTDVEVQVVNGRETATFQAHKLFLAMSSPQFAGIFYKNTEDFISPKSIKIFDYAPHIVDLMLRYLYTDQLKIANVDEAKNLYCLAKKYCINDLVASCAAYLSKEDITIENLMEKYEFALSEDIQPTLNACRNFVSTQTNTVLQSPQFLEAQQSVVEDILKLDILSVKSELELLDFAIQWAKKEYVRRSTFTETLRICLYPLFKYIRFLTLSGPEFLDFVEKYDNILNSHESTMLTMAIIQPGPGRRLPPGFSPNAFPRVFPDSDMEKYDFSPSTKDIENKSPTIQINDLKQNELSQQIAKSNENSKTFDFENSLKEHLRYKDGMSKIGKQEQKPDLKVKNLGFANLDMIRPSSTETNEFAYKSKSNSHIDLSKCIGAFPENQVVRSNGYYAKRVEPNLMYIKKQSPVLKVSPQLMSKQRNFEFHLHDMTRSPNTAFPADIKCSANIFVRKGTIEIYGIELKIQNRNQDEEIIAYLTLEGSNYTSKSIEYNEKLRNEMYPIVFPEPVKLSANNHLLIEVIIEDLVLNRCWGFGLNKHELNCGLGTMAEISLKSNQESFFLINQLLYKPY